jgi:signal transduction histidine kinase/CheY-like chemotaxis protein
LSGPVKALSGSDVAAKPLTSAVLARQTMNLQTMDEDDEEAPALTLVESRTQMNGPNNAKKVPIPNPKNPNCLFYRAAELIRKSTYADGVVFFRAVGLGTKSKVPEHLSSEDTSVDDSTSAGSDNAQQSIPHKPKKGPMLPTINSPKFKKPKYESSTEAAKLCEVIGLSISENAPDEDRLCPNEFVFSDASMEHYLRKFPHGKFFSFTESGSGVSSGDDKSDLDGNINESFSNSKRTRFIPTELLRILPSIRTLIFLPLWDSTVERWIAGAFIWTSNTGALMSPHNELPYLKAFGNSITSEYARMNALIADRAKSDFISSISHELRSPLHGILGSVEFLYDTEVTNYQEHLLSSIETCSKTLLETLEHILDYAKINKVNNSRGNRRLEAKTKRGAESSIMGPVRDDVDINRIIEEVTESVCAGHAFKETHNPTSFPTHEKKEANDECNLKHVSVSLEIVPRAQFLVRTQPGALRRIIMNLLGNALKYTYQGFIAVRVKTQRVPGSGQIDVTLNIQDSGKGMSLEYQRTRLFSPFSQEDPFSDGTGLGLSIVRQIVDSLGGQIDIRSKKDIGTTVEVQLSLPTSETQPSDSMQDVQFYSRGKRLALLKRDDCPEHLLCCYEAVINNSQEWFGVDAYFTDGTDLAVTRPDAVICSETFTRFKELNAAHGIPFIIVCKNQTNQVGLRKKLIEVLPEHEKWNFRILAQPVGPAKLSQALKHIWSPRQAISPAVLSDMPSPSIGEYMAARPVPTPAQPPARSVTVKADAPTREELSQRAITDPSKPHSGISGNQPPIPTRPIPIRLKSGLAEHKIKTCNHHILCVEDNQVNMRLLTMFMRKINLPYSSACNGLEALETYKSCATTLNGASSPMSSAASSFSNQTASSILSPSQEHPISAAPFMPMTNSATADAARPFTFVLMDISMPVMDGLEATRRIRSYERANGVRKAIIVALTGLASAEAQREALDAGVDFYLAKPVKFVDLRRLMEV